VYRDKGGIVNISEKPAELFGIAVDIGTTTLAMALVELRSGQVRKRYSAVNKQRESGGDVISRMRRANAGDLPLLSGSIRRQISEGSFFLCTAAGVDPGDICRMGIAGNTTMIHLLLALSCANLGQVPFTPVTLDMITFKYREVFEGGLFCPVYVLPGICTYVGADISAGILFTCLHTKKEPVAFMDIGTNGEMALAVGEKILCTATAAGPAFEGGNIGWGAGSVPGAISKVTFKDGRFLVSTIGEKAPVGICGSGVVDIAACGLESGRILPSGRFNKEYKNEFTENGIFLAKHADGRDICFSQKDVRELQLAKSAISSGLDALVHHAGLSYDEIKTLYIAGGFGFNLKLAGAARIGLIPPALVPKVTLVGNSSLGGVVKFLLDSSSEREFEKIIPMAEEFDLPGDDYFNAIFIKNVNFE
jgi:uncharacterized 2Fe-2S/4Fe-4S cluster protein (DUF4445 family)